MAPREGGGGGGGKTAHAVRDRDFANGHKNVREEEAIWRGWEGEGREDRAATTY